MWKKLRFPIRWKVMVTLLFVVTLVMSLITFTMARMFHDDKKTYIHDLSSIVALNISEESSSRLAGYSELLKTYARILDSDGITRDEKARMLRGFFGDFGDLVAITMIRNGEETASAYNSMALDDAGLTKQDIEAYRAANELPAESILEGDVYIRSVDLAPEFPLLTIAVGHTSANGPTTIIAALVDTTGLQQITRHTDVFDVFLIDADGRFLAHTDQAKVGHEANATLMEMFRDVPKQYGAGMAREFTIDGEERVGGFASARVGGVRAGVQIPRSAAFLASRDLLQHLLFAALGLLLLATVMGLLGAGTITRSIDRLSDATRVIAKGQFDVQVDVSSRDEIGMLADSFNQMTSELKTREEKLAEAQNQLVQSEKMAAFGQLGAGIAHEVKNPLAGILGCAQLSLRKAEPDTPVHKNLKLIEKETKRCKEIIESLLKFARQEKAVFETVDIGTVVEDAMAIVRHQLEMQNVKLEADTAEQLPKIQANANQIQQVLINLMMNAQQAMDGKDGRVLVTTQELETGDVEIQVVDNGPGMPPDVRQKIFEPFFTTKPGGKGTGLGLSVSFGIIRDHNGKIDVDSTVGVGTTFRIVLPAGQEAPGDGPAAPQPPETHDNPQKSPESEEEALVSHV